VRTRLSTNDDLRDNYICQPEELMIRALVYGRPQNLEQLNKYLFKGTRGLWEHQMITKAEVAHFQFGNSIK